MQASCLNICWSVLLCMRKCLCTPWLEIDWLANPKCWILDTKKYTHPNNEWTLHHSVTLSLANTQLSRQPAMRLGQTKLCVQLSKKYFAILFSLAHVQLCQCRRPKRTTLSSSQPFNVRSQHQIVKLQFFNVILSNSDH